MTTTTTPSVSITSPSSQSSFKHSHNSQSPPRLSSSYSAGMSLPPSPPPTTGFTPRSSNDSNNNVAGEEQRRGRSRRISPLRNGRATTPTTSIVSARQQRPPSLTFRSSLSLLAPLGVQTPERQKLTPPPPPPPLVSGSDDGARGGKQSSEVNAHAAALRRIHAQSHAMSIPSSSSSSSRAGKPPSSTQSSNGINAMSVMQTTDSARRPLSLKTNRNDAQSSSSFAQKGSLRAPRTRVWSGELQLSSLSLSSNGGGGGGGPVGGYGRPSSPKPYDKPKPASLSLATMTATTTTASRARVVAPRPVSLIAQASTMDLDPTRPSKGSSSRHFAAQSIAFPIATAVAATEPELSAILPVPASQISDHHTNTATTALREIQAQDKKHVRGGDSTSSPILMQSSTSQQHCHSTPIIRRAATTPTSGLIIPSLRPSDNGDVAPISPFQLPSAVVATDGGFSQPVAISSCTSDPRPIRLARHATTPASTTSMSSPPPTSSLASSFDSRAAYERVKSEEGYVRFDDVMGINDDDAREAVRQGHDHVM